MTHDPFSEALRPYQAPRSVGRDARAVGVWSVALTIAALSVVLALSTGYHDAAGLVVAAYGGGLVGIVAAGGWLHWRG